jgi:hypothetical protein
MAPDRPANEEAANEAGAESMSEHVLVSRAELEELRTRGGAAAPRSRDGNDSTAPTAEPEGLEQAWRAREAALERELAVLERKAAEWRRAFGQALRERELATALSGKSLVPGAAAQLLKLLRDDFDVYEEGGEFKVASRDGRAVAQVVAERLNEREYAHFCQPSTRGGTDVRGGNRPAAIQLAPAPRTLGESVITQWQAMKSPEESTTPIGLRRRR